MTAAPNDLTTLDTALTWLGCQNDDAFGTLQRLITAISTAMQNLISRNIKAADHVEIFDGRGRSRIMMPDYPIISVSSVQIGELYQTSVPARSSASPGYTFSDKFVYVDPPYFFEKGRRNVHIAYRAGYATVPPDLEQACLIWLKTVMDGANYSAALKSASAGQTKLDFSFVMTKFADTTGPVPPSVMSFLVNYQKVVATW